MAKGVVWPPPKGLKKKERKNGFWGWPDHPQAFGGGPATPLAMRVAPATPFLAKGWLEPPMISFFFFFFFFNIFLF
jgi:hypothetical protein